MQGHPNGTVYIEDATYEVLAYSAGLTTAGEHRSVIECVKIGTETARRRLSPVSGRHFLADGQGNRLSQTLPGRRYIALSITMRELTGKGLSTVTYYDDRMVVLGSGTSAGKVYKITPTVVSVGIVWEGENGGVR